MSFPNDKPKQIMIANGPIEDCELTGCSGTGFGSDFWRINAWDVGFTEGGSSGGGLLDQNNLLVGVLTGGVGTNCGNFQWDEYYKLSASFQELKPYLDPLDTGATTLAGRDWQEQPPGPTVPTVSQWGTLSMILLMLTTATIAFRFPVRVSHN